MCCFSVCFFKARLLRMRGGAVGFSATAFIERRRPSVQERCVRKESVGRIVFCHTLKAMWQRGWLGIFASLQKEKAGKGEKILPRGGWSRPVSCYSYQTSTGVRGSVSLYRRLVCGESVQFSPRERVLCHTNTNTHDTRKREHHFGVQKDCTENTQKV
jgi:hypothetical protein